MNNFLARGTCPKRRISGVVRWSLRIVLSILILTFSTAGVLIWRFNKPPEGLIGCQTYRLSDLPAYTHSAYRSEAFVLECEQLQVTFVDNYWRQDDFHGKYYTVENGIRRTVGQPAHYAHTIWLAGNSAVFDPLLPDAYTMATQLQAIVPHGWRVVNLGVGGQPTSHEFEWLKTQPIAPGDIVVLIDGQTDVDAPVAHYKTVVKSMRTWVQARGATFYHFMQALQDSRSDALFSEMAEADAVRLYAPVDTFIDWAHTNEIGGAIIAHTICAAVFGPF